jgi:nicotinate-nucleotide pyrophosphorylase (carboxylating)
MRVDFGSEEYSEARRVIEAALAEDHATEDLTSALTIPSRLRARATLRSRVEGVIAGLPCIEICLDALGADVRLELSAEDGNRVQAGETLGRLVGGLAPILAAERTILNLIGFLSGTATLTRNFVDLAGPRCRVLDTRKTLPGMRRLQKYAVRCGGGLNHRIHLADGILLKDNHRWTGLKLAELVERARRKHPQLVVVVEVDTLEQLEEVLGLQVDRALLDNFTPEQVREAVQRRERAGARVALEVSGGVGLDTVAAFAHAGADYVSVGALTHSAPCLDIGLDLEVEAGGELH